VAGGGGPKSAVTVYTLWFLVSRAMVRAPRCVVIVWTTVYLSGESSCATVIVPSAQEANTSPVAGSKRFASTPLPIAHVQDNGAGDLVDSHESRAPTCSSSQLRLRTTQQPRLLSQNRHYTNYAPQPPLQRRHECNRLWLLKNPLF